MKLGFRSPSQGSAKVISWPFVKNGDHGCISFKFKPLTRMPRTRGRWIRLIGWIRMPKIKSRRQSWLQPSKRLLWKVLPLQQRWQPIVRQQRIPLQPLLRWIQHSHSAQGKSCLQAPCWIQRGCWITSLVRWSHSLCPNQEMAQEKRNLCRHWNRRTWTLGRSVCCKTWNDRHCFFINPWQEGFRQLIRSYSRNILRRPEIP